MGNKLVDGNITIEDRASRGLTVVEKQLVDVAKKGKSAAAAMERLNKVLARSPMRGNRFTIMGTDKNGDIKSFVPPTLRPSLYHYGFSEYRTYKYTPKESSLDLSSRRSPVFRSLGAFGRDGTIIGTDKNGNIKPFFPPRPFVHPTSRLSLSSLDLSSRHSPVSRPIGVFGRDALDASLRELKKQNPPLVNDLDLARLNFIKQNRFAIMSPDKKGNIGQFRPPTSEEIMRKTRYAYAPGISSLDLASRRSTVSHLLTEERSVNLQDMVQLNQRAIPRGLKGFSAEDMKTFGRRFKELDENFGRFNRNITNAPQTGGGGNGGGGGIITRALGGAFGGGGDGSGGGRITRALGGALSGRLTGSLLGGGGAKFLGTVVGAGASAGPVGVAIGIASAGIIAGLTKIVDAVQGVIDTINRIASERARESVGLRRKMQMSSEMFNVNPEDIESIDKKIYAMREEEQEMYLHGLPGRDITTSTIDWLHLMGTKETTGGVFENEKEAFEFSKAIAAISKMNDLSPQEYETVRYQGMQILSKGYADILDIKPLLNSAPGFVRDLLQQTGMTRKEFLESGRSRSFTADMFKQALLNVSDYYETLADRATSRTIEQQQESAENIVGRAAIYDELYNKEKAKSNMLVANATIEASIAERIEESWYAMWSDTNDAQDGVVKKVEFEKKMTGMILKGLNSIVLGVTIVKNIFDMLINTLVMVGKEIIALSDLIPSTLKGAFGSLFAWVFRQLGSLPMFDEKEWNARADAVDPNAKSKLSEAFLTSRATEINKFISKLDPNVDFATLTGELTKMGMGEEKIVGYEERRVVPQIEKQMVWDESLGHLTPTGMSTGGWREPLPWENSLKRQRVRVPDEKNAYMEKVPIKENVLPEWFVKGLFFGGGNANEKTKRVADESYRYNFLLEHPEMWAELKDGIWQDKEAFKDLEGQTRSLSAVLGGAAKSGNDYTWGNRLLGTFINPIKDWMKENGQDMDDMKRAKDNYDKANREYQKAAENVHGGYIPKIAGDVHKLARGKGNEKILDVLKEITGVVVINKVTQVRPDVVFNYGSYGRNGLREQLNAIRTGDGSNPPVGSILSAMVEALTSLAGKWDDRFQSIVNGVEEEIAG